MLGQVRLIEKEKSLEYGLYTGGTFENLSNILNNCLLENVKVNLKFDNKQFLYEGKLELKKNKKEKSNVYKYHIDNDCELDNLLWTLADSNKKVHIYIKNIGNEQTKEDIK